MIYKSLLQTLGKTCTICVCTANGWHFPSLIFGRSLTIKHHFVYDKMHVLLSYNSVLGRRQLKVYIVQTLSHLFRVCDLLFSLVSSLASRPHSVGTCLAVPAEHQTCTAASSIIPHTPVSIPSNYYSCRLKSPMETLLYGSITPRRTVSPPPSACQMLCIKPAYIAGRALYISARPWIKAGRRRN